MTTMVVPEAIADAELVARSRRRDADAFGQLVERHQRLVFGVALARCHDPALAEDLAQEAFVAAWRDLHRLRDGDRVGTWVAGIARNLASSAARTQARRAIELPVANDDVPTPEDAALEREDRELLQRALAEVPAAHREALVLYYLEGQSIAQIAAALGVREDLVKQRLSRGRKALRDGVAARVESALARARTRPALRAGVVAAVSVLGARDAAAAGKVIAAMSIKKLTVVALAVVLAGGAIWIGTRSRDDAGATTVPAPPGAAAGGAAAAATPVERAAVSPKVRRLGSAAERTRLLDAIRAQAQARGRAEPPEAVPGSDGDRPTLPPDASVKQYIRAAVKEIVPQIMDCYEEGLLRDLKLAGTVAVSFLIEGEPGVGGVINHSEIDNESSTLTDPAVRECIQETMYLLEIDPPADGGTLRVRFPFLFRPATGPEGTRPMPRPER